jgi:hypothetical protein
MREALRAIGEGPETRIVYAQVLATQLMRVANGEASREDAETAIREMLLNG